MYGVEGVDVPTDSPSVVRAIPRLFAVIFRVSLALMLVNGMMSVLASVVAAGNSEIRASAISNQSQ